MSAWVSGQGQGGGSDEDYYSGSSASSTSTLSAPGASRVSFATQMAEASIDDFFRARPLSPAEFYDLQDARIEPRRPPLPPRRRLASHSPPPRPSILPPSHQRRPGLPRPDSGLALDMDEPEPSDDFAARADMREMADAALSMIARLKRLLREEREANLRLEEEKKLLAAQKPPPLPEAAPPPRPQRRSAQLSSITEEHLYEEILYEDVLADTIRLKGPPLPPRRRADEEEASTLPKPSFKRSVVDRLSLPKQLLRLRLSSASRRKARAAKKDSAFAPLCEGDRAVSETQLRDCRPHSHRTRPEQRFGGSAFNLASAIVRREPSRGERDAFVHRPRHHASQPRLHFPPQAMPTRV